MSEFREITMARPDDFHVHLRSGTMMQEVVRLTRPWRRALVMPNLEKPILTAEDALRYHDEIERAKRTHGVDFEPLMTIQITKDTSSDIIHRARIDGKVLAGKVSPRGLTTNSEFGVVDYPKELYSTLLTMEETGMVLSLHGEKPGTFSLDRERAFLETLSWIIEHFPRLKIVLEHITTAASVGFVMHGPPTLAATITPHHLYLTLDDVIGTTLRPHNFCKPIAKYPHDLRALRSALTSGNPRFFAGTDSAPHSRERKECDHGCAGIFSAPTALSLYLDAFEEEDAFLIASPFLNEYGARFYGLPPIPDQRWIQLQKKTWNVREMETRCGVKIFTANEMGDVHWNVLAS